MTSTKIDRKWIGLNSQNVRIVQMKKEDRATIAISPTQVLPMARWTGSPFFRKSCTAPSASAAAAQAA